MLCRYFVLFFRDLVFDLLQEGVILLGLFRCLYITICSRITEKSFRRLRRICHPTHYLKSFQWFVHLDDDSLFK